MSIVRVFPRRIRATPDDLLAFTGPPPGEKLPDVREAHVSAAFTYGWPIGWLRLGPGPACPSTWAARLSTSRGAIPSLAATSSVAM